MTEANETNLISVITALIQGNQKGTAYGEPPKAIKMYERHRILGLMQVAIMSAIETSSEAAYGTAIAARVSDMTGREVADAQVYVALQRLEHQGLIATIPDSHEPKSSKRTRGRPRKFYELTASGKRALARAGAYVNLDAADQTYAKERIDGGSTKKSPTFTPVVG